jgi:hypothetical protein
VSGDAIGGLLLSYQIRDLVDAEFYLMPHQMSMYLREMLATTLVVKSDSVIVILLVLLLSNMVILTYSTGESVTRANRSHGRVSHLILYYSLVIYIALSIASINTMILLQPRELWSAAHALLIPLS